MKHRNRIAALSRRIAALRSPPPEPPDPWSEWLNAGAPLDGAIPEPLPRPADLHDFDVHWDVALDTYLRTVAGLPVPAGRDPRDVRAGEYLAESLKDSEEGREREERGAAAGRG